MTTPVNHIAYQSAIKQSGLFLTCKLSNVSDIGKHGFKAVEQPKAVGAQSLILIHDKHLVEETVDRCAKTGQGCDDSSEIFGRECGVNSGLGGVRCLQQLALGIAKKRSINIDAKIGICKMAGASIGGRKVIEGVRIAVAGVLKGVRQSEVINRSAHGTSGNGGDGIGVDLLVAGHLLQTTLDKRANRSADGTRIELDALLCIGFERYGNELLIPRCGASREGCSKCR